MLTMNAKQQITVELDQPVMVFSGYGRKVTIVSGKIVKVARVWITVQGDDFHWQTWRFRLDDQTDGSEFASRSWFMTIDQYAVHQRTVEAEKLLREQGIDLRFDSPWRERKAELADLIRAGLAAAEQVTTTQEG